MGTEVCMMMRSMQNTDGSMEVTVLTPTSLLVPARRGERMRVTASVLSNEIETSLLLSDDEAAVVLCGPYSHRQLQNKWYFVHPTYCPVCECDCEPGLPGHHNYAPATSECDCN